MSETEIAMLEDIEYESIPNSSVTTQLIAGALAGITEHTVTYPVDFIKTRMQVLSTNPAAAYSGIGNAFSKILSTEGALKMWRGVSTVIVGSGPAHALYFTTYEQFKELFGGNKPGHHFLATGAAGACATIAHDGLMNPFDVIKQRMQLHGSQSSVFQTALKILRSEGLSAFYVSYPTTLTMSIPYQTIHFSAYEYFRKIFNPSNKYDPKTHIMAGGLAGAIAATITTPLDVTKTLLQTKGTSSDEAIKSVKGMGEAMKLIYSRHGFAGFLRGLQPRVFSHMPATAICWTTYEFLKHIITRAENIKPKSLPGNISKMEENTRL